ncbi:hypothetical protein ACFSHT_30300 [Paraburkholderia silviterrae]|uniref:Cytochrome c domain-containing protein n=1 Tax=Paraburkholderia silviterrae TaxID=2528715 RepID=A0A4R5LY89_9BURK|nr:hypothetical protein [Paraburkholderia silviterrae]TDG17281.1 hypothetical protein EYW47_38345 [Paraburkholderia silviterrae]
MRSLFSSRSEWRMLARRQCLSSCVITGVLMGASCLLAWSAANAAATAASAPVACASASCAPATSKPAACKSAASSAKAACEADATELANAIKRYPAASVAPPPSKDGPPDGEVDKSAPPDEAGATVTARGVRLFPRNEQCFPTETRNLFSEVDKVVVGADRTPRPMDWFDGHSVPKAARSAIMGQNTWMLWGEGNEAFWGWVQENGYGIADFLVLLNSKNRAHRFRDGGLINQPGMVERDTPMTGLGLYIDGPDGDKVTLHAPQNDVGADGKSVEPVKMPNDPAHHHQTFFEVDPEAQALYDQAIAQLGNDGVDPLVYGYPSGVVGLRLWPNPDFFGKSPAAKQAREHWNEQVVSDQGKRYYSTDPKDADFHADPLLIRPFRVSMACSFCHVGPHPLSPPKDMEHPEWGDMSSMIGNQYWLPSNAFTNLKTPDSFLWQFVASQQPGTIDTSLVATDHINNPNTINAIFEVNARLARAAINPPEEQSKSNLMLRGIEDAPLFTLDPRHTPRVLLDGADSIGIEGALLRVYLNIGAYSEQWRRVQNTIVGFTAQRPFDIATIKEKSVYWNTTEHFRVEELENFFTYVTQSGATVTQPMKLASTEEGLARINANQADSEKGRDVFIRNCAICHSSKQPPNLQISFSHDWRTANADAQGGITLPMDFADWEAFKLSAPWLAYVDRLQKYIAAQPNGGQDFFEKDNYLSTDVRVPITLVGTNSQRAVGTNGMRGQVWDNFSSETYKSLPAVGVVHFYNPFRKTSAVDKWGNNDEYAPPGGGPGYYRPASLVSVWATAPLLHNNALGIYNRDPSVKGRLEAYDDAIDKLFNNSKRAVIGTPAYGAARLVNVYPAQKEAFCHDHPADQSLECSALRGDFRQSFAAAGVADQPGFRDIGFIYRTTKDSYIDFAPRYIKPLVSGILGERLTSILFIYVWLVLALIAFVLIFVGQPRLAGGLLALLAALVATVLRVSGVDTIYLGLWLIPLVPFVLAVAFFRFPNKQGWARAFFAVSVVVFAVMGGLGKALLDGRLIGIDIGPIPRGTPVNLLMNIDPDAPTVDLLHAAAGLTRGVLLVRRDDPKDGSFKALGEFQREAGPALLKASKCPDFVLDRGHWFGETLSDDEKRQLKAFLETL